MIVLMLKNPLTNLEKTELRQIVIKIIIIGGQLEEKLHMTSPQKIPLGIKLLAFLIEGLIIKNYNKFYALKLCNE
jgi:hypothetical protein